MKTIAIIENNHHHLNIIASHIKAHPHYQLLTTQENGFAFLEYCFAHKHLPDIALIDVDMPVMDGVVLTDFLYQFFNNMLCIGVTNHHHNEMIEDMISCGASGLAYKIFTAPESTLITLKKERFEDIDACIDAVAQGNFCIDNCMKLLSHNYAQELDIKAMKAQRKNLLEANGYFSFTEKEQMMMMLCAGSSAKLEAIASLLSYDVKTLEYHLSKIYKKLGVANRLALTHLCLSQSIVKNSRGIRVIK